MLVLSILLQISLTNLKQQIYWKQICKVRKCCQWTPSTFLLTKVSDLKYGMMISTSGIDGKTLKVRSHQNYFFARPNPMKSQRTDACGCDRRDIFPGGAFGAMRRVYSGAFSAAQFSPLVEIFQLWGGHLATRANQLLCSALVALEAEVFQT